MSAPTLAARAATARATRSRSQKLRRTADPCPGCSTDLTLAGGLTRRLAIYGGAAGLFHWVCPDCGHNWAETASSQVGSTTRTV